MADAPITKYTTIRRSRGESATPSIPPSTEDPQPPVNPPGSSSFHNPVTLGTPANGLSLAGQQLSLGLASSGVTGALSGADWNTFDAKIEGTIAGGQVAFGIGNGVIYGDDSFIWDNGK